MPALVGTLSLALALALALYGGTAAIVGARTGRPRVVESARTAAYSLFALVVVANLAMLAALLADDFSLRYVASNSSRATPTFFKVLALWSADEGSLLLWNLVLGGYLAAVAFRFRARRPETFPWALAVMFGVSAFYLVLVLGPTTPFATLATAAPDGRGPLPLLQNHPLMAAHPPFLYLGFIGFTVPFAFAIAALVTGRVSDAWMRITRRWTIAAWIFLAIGLVLGALWSYSVLGWGGYWAWDPVENVALLPWLLGTAFLHSVMVQERRGMLKVWNLSLIVGTFALTVLGTFLTRGSILASVHAFADSIVGPLYLVFLTVVLLGGFGLIAWRRESLRAEATFDTPLSRESVFLGNNILLLVLTFTVLVGTIYPLLAEAVTGGKVSVGSPFFNRNTAPVALLLLFLMGIGPLLPWRAASLSAVLRRLQVPMWAAATTAVVLASAGAGVAAVVVFGLAAFVATATVAEMVRGVQAQRRARGLSIGGGHGRRGVQEPSPVRRARGASRTDRRGHRRVVVGALGPFVGGDDRRGRDRACGGLRPAFRRAHGQGRAAPTGAGRRAHGAGSEQRARGRAPPAVPQPVPGVVRADRDAVDPGRDALQRHDGPVRLARHGRGPDARLVPLLREPGDRTPVVRWRRDGARRHRGGMAVRAAAGEHAPRPEPVVERREEVSV